MALNIKIDIENRYELQAKGNNLRYNIFTSPLTNGDSTKMVIKISDEEHPIIPDVCNLAFGPPTEKNEIDDSVKLTHQDHSKVFSTIVFASLTLLTAHKEKYLGIDGSNTARAYMYYRCIQNNFHYLDTFFTIYGIKYYLRVLRDDCIEYDPEDILAIPKRITKGEDSTPSNYTTISFSI